MSLLDQLEGVRAFDDEKRFFHKRDISQDMALKQMCAQYEYWFDHHLGNDTTVCTDHAKRLLESVRITPLLVEEFCYALKTHEESSKLFHLSGQFLNAAIYHLIDGGHSRAMLSLSHLSVPLNHVGSSLDSPFTLEIHGSLGNWCAMNIANMSVIFYGDVGLHGCGAGSEDCDFYSPDRDLLMRIHDYGGDLNRYHLMAADRSSKEIDLTLYDSSK